MDKVARATPRWLPVRLRVMLFFVTAGCVAVALYLLTRPGRHGDPVRFDPAILLLLIGWAAAGVAVAGWWPRRRWLVERCRQRLDGVRRRPLLAGLAVVVLIAAAAIRILPLGEVPPPGVPWYEEMQTGGIAHGILYDASRPLDYPIVNYGAALSFLLFGQSTTALRVPFIFLGWLTVVLFYATARYLFRPQVALFATAMFAVSRWHVHVNHVADENAPPLVVLMAVLYLVVSSRTRHGVLRCFALGTLLGLVPYVYPGYRFLLVLVPSCFVGRWLMRRLGWGDGSAPVWNRRRAAVAGLLIAMCIVLVPLVEAAVTGDQRASILLNIRRDHSFNLPGVGDQDWQRTAELASSVFRFIFYDLSCEWVSAGGRPALEPIAAVMVLAGFLWALVTFWRPARGMLAFWVPVVIFLGTVAMGANYLHRLCAVIPMLYLLIGFPVDDLWGLLERSRSRLPEVILGIGVMALFIVEAMGNVRTMMVQYPSDPRVQKLFEDLSLELPIHARELADGETVFLWSDLRDPIHYFRPSEATWLTGVLDGRPMLSLFDPLPVRGEVPPRGMLLGFRLFRYPITPLEADRMASFFYPGLGAAAARDASPLGRIDYLYYRLPASTIESRRGLYGRYFEPAAGRESPVLVRVDPLDGAPAGAAPTPSIVDGVWTGLAWMESGAEYRFTVESDGVVGLRINAQPVIGRASGRGATGVAAVDRGWQVVQLEVSGMPSTRPPRLLFSSPGDEPTPFAGGDLHAVGDIHGLVRTWIMRRDGVDSVYERRIEPTVSQQMVEAMMRRVREQQGGAELVQERWEGWLTVDRTTEVRIRINSRQGVSRLGIDGETVLEVPLPGHPGARQRETTTVLEPGARHLLLTFDYEFVGDYHGGVELGYSEGPTAFTTLPVERLSPIQPPDAATPGR